MPMLTRFAAVAAVSLAIAGCNTPSDPYYMRTSAAPATPQNESGVGEPEWMKPRDYRNGGPVPPMERNRAVNEQSCTEGIALTAGNLKCK